jgi:hypothetical protein
LAKLAFELPDFGEVFGNFFVTHALQAAVFQDEFLGQDARDDLQVVLWAFTKHDFKRDLADPLEMLLGFHDEIRMQAIARTLAASSGFVAGGELPRLLVSLVVHVAFALQIIIDGHCGIFRHPPNQGGPVSRGFGAQLSVKIKVGGLSRLVAATPQFVEREFGHR